MKNHIEMLGFPQQPSAQKPPGERFDSFTEMPTHLISLSPEFLDALKKLAPKTRPRRWPYALSAAMVGCVGIAMGARFRSHHDTVGGASPAPSATTPASTARRADPVETAPSTATPDVNAARPSGTPSAGRPAERPTPIAVDALPHAATRKAPKTLHSQSPP